MKRQFIKRQKDFTLLKVIAFVLLLVVVAGSWVANAAKLLACDFEPDYKCEFIHGSGLFFMPLSVVTVWFDDDGA